MPVEARYPHEGAIRLGASAADRTRYPASSTGIEADSALQPVLGDKSASVTLEEAKAILAALVHEHVEFVVIGSMAMAAQGLPRATHDLDLFVSPKIENLEAVKRALRGLFDDPSVDQIDPRGAGRGLPGRGIYPPHGHYSMDILTRLGEAFTWQDLAANCDEIELGDLLACGLATPKMLYLMKKDTVRPQDRADAARIRDAFDLEDE